MINTFPVEQTMADQQTRSKVWNYFVKKKYSAQLVKMVVQQISTTILKEDITWPWRSHMCTKAEEGTWGKWQQFC